jgi:deoxyribonuclease V
MPMSDPEFVWPETLDQARNMQECDSRRVVLEPLKKEPVYIAGVDATFSEYLVFAAVCLYRFPELTLVEQNTAVKEITFPYVPGYLLFREGPAIIAALYKLRIKPDVILVDGHGIAHRRGIGSASHLGVLLDISTIGCAKKRLVGEYHMPGEKKGNWTELKLEENTVGAVLRTRNGVRPLFLSAGHRIDLQNAIRITVGCVGRYRIPEPLRCADILSKKMKLEYRRP